MDAGSGTAGGSAAGEEAGRGVWLAEEEEAELRALLLARACEASELQQVRKLSASLLARRSHSPLSAHTSQLAPPPNSPTLGPSSARQAPTGAAA